MLYMLYIIYAFYCIYLTVKHLLETCYIYIYTLYLLTMGTDTVSSRNFFQPETWSITENLNATGVKTIKLNSSEFSSNTCTNILASWTTCQTAEAPLCEYWNYLAISWLLHSYTVRLAAFLKQPLAPQLWLLSDMQYLYLYLQTEVSKSTSSFTVFKNK